MLKEAERKIIFLIEDNQGDIRLIQEAFKSTGTPCEVAVARDGVEAMRRLREEGFGQFQQPDLILLDLNMPKKDGRELLAEIKADPSLKHIPVVVLTTSQNEEDIYDCYDLHVNCYITKSRTLAQLFTIVKGIEEFWLKTAALPRQVTS
ncbi:MAG: response regulator [Cyanobacteria bacterium J06627_28]